MARKSKEDAAETREKILSAALDVFSRKGYSHTTFVDIAKEIGMTKGAIYWHFKTKPDLLAAVMSHEDGKQCAQIMSTPPQSVAELRSAILQIARKVVENEHIQKFEFFCAFQIEWSTELMAEVKEKLKEQREDPMIKFTATLTHLQECGELKKEANVEALAYALASMWVGSLHMALIEKCSFKDFYTLLEQHFDMLIGQYSTRPLIDEKR